MQKQLLDMIDNIKKLLQHGYDGDDLHLYLESEIKLGRINADLMKQIVDQAAQNAAIVQMICAQHGITDASHVRIVRHALALLAQSLGDDDKAAGVGGHGEDAANDGADDGSIVRTAANQAVGH